MQARLTAVSSDADHRFSKTPVEEVEVVEGIGIRGDAHSGRTVKHRSRVARDPSAPNLRQVHLIASELFEALAREGFEIRPGDLGENLTTAGIDLLALPTGTVLRIGAAVELEVTGLRNPCSQIEAFRPGLLAQVLRREGGKIVRKAGIMAIVRKGGTLRAGDRIGVRLPPPPHRPLERV